jgi:hypothetical protein
MSSHPDELQDMINRGTGVPQSVQQRTVAGTAAAPATRPAMKR